MNAIRTYVIRRWGLKGSWAWAVKQLLNGYCVTYDTPGYQTHDVFSMDGEHAVWLQQSIDVGAGWLTEQTTWHICPAKEQQEPTKMEALK